MKKYYPNIIATVFALFLTYLIFSFVQMEFNPAVWTIQIRTFMVIVFMFLTFIASMFLATINDY